jgi:hypothetical protein
MILIYKRYHYQYWQIRYNASMECLSLTMPCPANGRGRPLALAAAAACVVAGMVLAIGLGALWPLAVSIAAGMAGAWLLQAQPLLRHVEYFAANEDGLRYVHTPGAAGRVSHYPWTAVIAVSAELAGAGPCLLLQTGRGAARGQLVRLAMGSEADCLAAQRAIERWLAAYRL